MKPYILLPVLALAMVACQSTEPVVPNPGINTRATVPVTAFADVELFGENPLTAFQRTGNPPLPVANYPVNTPVTIHSQSGAFYQVTMPDMRTGWMAARNVTGVGYQIPAWAGGTNPLNPVTPQTLPPSSGEGLPVVPNGGGQPETIDLDRIP